MRSEKWNKRRRRKFENVDGKNDEVLKDTVPQMLTAAEQKVDECSGR